MSKSPGDATPDQVLPHLPAVVLDGAKAVAMTAIAFRRAASSWLPRPNSQRDRTPNSSVQCYRLTVRAHADCGNAALVPRRPAFLVQLVDPLVWSADVDTGTRRKSANGQHARGETHLSRLVDEATWGAQFVIANAARPLVRVVSLDEAASAQPSPRPRRGFLRAQIRFPDDPADFNDVAAGEIADLFEVPVP